MEFYVNRLRLAGVVIVPEHLDNYSKEPAYFCHFSFSDKGTKDGKLEKKRRLVREINLC